MRTSKEAMLKAKAIACGLAALALLPSCTGLVCLFRCQHLPAGQHAHAVAPIMSGHHHHGLSESLMHAASAQALAEPCSSGCTLMSATARQEESLVRNISHLRVVAAFTDREIIASQPLALSPVPTDSPPPPGSLIVALRI